MNGPEPGAAGASAARGARISGQDQGGGAGSAGGSTLAVAAGAAVKTPRRRHCGGALRLLAPGAAARGPSIGSGRPDRVSRAQTGRGAETVATRVGPYPLKRVTVAMP